MSETPATSPATGASAADGDGSGTRQPPDTFPPTCIGAFLRCCDGEWLSLRSDFASLGMPPSLPLGTPQSMENATDVNDGEAWHSSERTELRVTYLMPEQTGEPGGLAVAPRQAPAQATQVSFCSDGRFSTTRTTCQQPAAEGRWTLWPDGSLELLISTAQGELCEKIWFTKPNLRLRSTLEIHADGTPGRACFCSEIRRVSRPAG